MILTIKMDSIVVFTEESDYTTEGDILLLISAINELSKQRSYYLEVLKTRISSKDIPIELCKILLA